MAKQIIIKSVSGEKSSKLATDAALNQYTFQVCKSANKIEIAQAIKARFGVEVLSVNTMVVPGKRKSRMVKGRMAQGITSSYKKAIVTVAEGQYIEDFLGMEEVEETVAEGEETEQAEA